MTDLSEFSTEQLMQMGGIESAPSQAFSSNVSLSEIPTEQLMQMAGITPQQKELQSLPATTSPSYYDIGMGGFKGIAKAGTDVLLSPADLMYRGGNWLINKLPFTDEVNPEGGYPSDYRDRFLNYLSGDQGDPTAEAVTHIGGNLASILANPYGAKDVATKITPILSKVPGASRLAPLLGLGAEGAAQAIYMNPKGDLGSEASLGGALNIGAAGLFKGLGKVWNAFVPTQKVVNTGAQALGAKIVDQFREVAPDAFSKSSTLEERATSMALGLNKTAREARRSASKLFENLPEDSVILDDAIEKISQFAQKVEGPIKPGGTVNSLVGMLQGLKPADKIIETPASVILNETGQPMIQATKEVIQGGPAVLPLNKVQDTLRDIGRLQRGASGVDRAVLKVAQDEILTAAEKSVSPESMQALKDARKAWAAMSKTYEESAVGAVRKSLLEPGKRLSTLKTKLLNDPKTAEELTSVMTPDELVNAQNLVLMDLTAKQPVAWERAISKQYDSYKHIFGEANTEKLLQMVSREGTIGSKLLRDNNELSVLLARTGLKSAIGGGIGYGATQDWKGALIGAALTTGRGKLDGKILNQAKSLIMRAAIGSPEALKILNTTSKNPSVFAQGIKKLATILPTGIQREMEQDASKQQDAQPLKTPTNSFNNSTKFLVENAMKKAEAKMAENDQDELKTPVIVSAKKITSDKDLESIIDKQIKAESSGNPKAVGPQTKYGKAKGLMQLLDSTAKEQMQKMGLDPKKWDPFDAELNKKVGIAYLKEMLEKYDNNIQYALAAYNWGPGNFSKFLKGKIKKMPLETRAYVKRITGEPFKV